MKRLAHILNARLLAIATLLLLCGFHAQAQSQPVAYVAIIIDDLGNNLSAGKALIEIPAPLTLAILPHTAHSKTLATAANKAHKEVMIHLPMANVNNTPIGPGGLTANQSRVDFLLALDAAIENIPFAKGINNHTGSYLTQQPQQMRWLMKGLKEKGLFFIDSRTTEKSVALNIAKELKVDTASRNVFLDNNRNKKSIDEAFQKLIEKAHADGTAIAIGHPYPETLSYLQQQVPNLEAQGIKLISASSLIKIQRGIRPQTTYKLTYQ